MDHQTSLVNDLDQARAAVLYDLSVESQARACCRGLALDELCDWRHQLYIRLDRIDCRLHQILAEKRAPQARRTSRSSIQRLFARVSILEKSKTGQVRNGRLSHGKH